MHFDKALSEQSTLQEDRSCSDAFDELVALIEDLPPELRAAKALNLAAHLVEMSAFELAGSIDSVRIGALIQAAAKLFDESGEVATDRILSLGDPKRALQ